MHFLVMICLLQDAEARLADGGTIDVDGPLILEQAKDIGSYFLRCVPAGAAENVPDTYSPQADWVLGISDATPNPNFLRPNRVFVWGYNMSPDGRNEHPEEVGFGNRWETFYENAGERWLEHHISVTLTNGEVFRPLAINVRTNNGANQFLGLTAQLAADFITMATPRGEKRFEFHDRAFNFEPGCYFNIPNYEPFARQITAAGQQAILFRLNPSNEMQYGDFVFGGAEQVEGHRFWTNGREKFRVVSFGSTSATIAIGDNAEDRLGFHGVTPISQQATVPLPTGGAIVDVQARQAISSLIQKMENVGLLLDEGGFRGDGDDPQTELERLRKQQQRISIRIAELETKQARGTQ